MDTRRAARLPKSEPGRPGTFDLQELMLKAHNSVAAEADARNLALSWFTAPYLPRAYEGDREKLAEVLYMLAESAVRATQRGAVHIRVQRVPESADPGHLLFTITDSGAGAPPQDRNPLALVRAWELVGLFPQHGKRAGRNFRLVQHTPCGAPAPCGGRPGTSGGSPFAQRVGTAPRRVAAPSAGKDRRSFRHCGNIPERIRNPSREYAKYIKHIQRFGDARNAPLGHA